MAEGGRHQYGNNNGGKDDMSFPELDWLEETPPDQQPRQRRASSGGQPQWRQEQPARQQRPAQPRQGQVQRPAQPRQGQAQRPAQQRPAQQRPAQPRQGQGQQRPQQQRPAQQRPVQQPRQSANGRRYVEVQPEEYRPKRRGRSSLPLIILVVILIGGILVAGVKLGSALLSYHRDRTAYNNLADEALSGLAEPNATQDPNAAVDTGVEQQAPSEAPFAVNWDYLRSVNRDIVGWLYCADTRINYPVVQCGDNDYYLHRDFTTQQPNVAGTLFVDYNAALGVNLSNFLIYGHNMKDGSMFAALQGYVAQDYYLQHPVMYFLTPDQNYRIDLLAARIVEASEENYPSYFLDESAFGNYLNMITSSSFFATQATVSTNYQMVSLSTCDYSGGYSNPRFLVQGMLVPIQ